MQTCLAFQEDTRVDLSVNFVNKANVLPLILYDFNKWFKLKSEVPNLIRWLNEQTDTDCVLHAFCITTSVFIAPFPVNSPFLLAVLDIIFNKHQQL